MPKCSYTGEVLDEPGCGTACQGCQWQSKVLCQHNGSSCSFTWTVTRSNCSFAMDKTFPGSATVPCDETLKVLFYCDPAGACPGYELSLVCGDCPSPPNGS